MELIFDQQNPEFSEEWNKRIVARFYYYHNLQNRPIEITYQILCDEFLLVFNDLDEFIKENSRVLNEMLTSKISIEDLRQQYYWLIWE
jgi:hypothetical protein